MAVAGWAEEVKERAVAAAAVKGSRYSFRAMTQSFEKR